MSQPNLPFLSSYSLHFDEESHTYTLSRGGDNSPLRIPSVTQIINENGLYASYARNKNAEGAMSRGRHIHKITELFDQSLLGPMDVDGEDAGYLSAYSRFIVDHEFTPLIIEEAMFHPAYLYAGKIDRIGIMKIGGEMIHAVVDIKTGGPHPATFLQLAAYMAMCKSQGNRVDRSYALHLTADGDYRLLTDPNPDYSFAVFTAAITLHNWRSSIGK